MLTLFIHQGTLSSDLIVLGLLVLFFFIYALYFGKSRIVSLIFAFYPARFFYEHFPYVNKLLVLSGDKLQLLNKIGIFLLFLIPISIVISRFIFAESGYGDSQHYFRIFGFAICSVILLLVFSYSIVSLDSFYNFSSQIDTLFSGTYIFWWVAAPFVILYFL